MCGIAALITTARVDLQNSIDAMTDAITHRGPDDRGVATFPQDGAAVGMRRLSIVDIEGGHQPMWSDDKRYCLVFNGEVYNAPELRGELIHLGQRFRTDHSDTEVLVHGFVRWGHELWPRLNGMFAVAIWDRVDQVLIAARDRIGKKPLFIAECVGGYALGSELKAVLQAPGVVREVDLVALEQYLTFDYVIAPRTMLAGTSKLPGGHYVEVTPTSCHVTQFWAPTCGVRPTSDDRATADLDGLLDDAVSRRLISDVPLGLFLSGGLDSSTIGHYMRRHCDEVHSFSIGFEEEDFDESHFSALAAKALGTYHHLEIFSQSRLQDLIPRIADVLDEPMGDQSIFPTYLLSMFTQQNVKVALGGDGSDELLMGYNTYLPLKAAWSIDRVPGLSRAIAETARRAPASVLDMGLRGLKFARQLDREPLELLLTVLGHFAGDARWVFSQDARSRLPASVFAEPATAMLAGVDGDPTGDEETVIGYMRGYLQEDIMVKVDRASMATSLEVRSPFLDPRVIDFALGLPTRMRLRGTTGKYVLRRLMRGRLPDEILDRPKVGFGVPLNQWLRESQRDLVIDYLSPARLLAQNIFDPEAVSRLVEEHVSGQADRGHQVWLLLLFQLWHERWIEPETTAHGGPAPNGRTAD